MNKERRKALDGAIEELNKAKGLMERIDFAEIIDILESAKAAVDEAKDEEQEAFDNMSEGLQATERGQRMEEVINSLEEAAGKIDEIISDLSADLPGDSIFNEAIEHITESIE
jgi:pantothenate kinase